MLGFSRKSRPAAARKPDASHAQADLSWLLARAGGRPTHVLSQLQGAWDAPAVRVEIPMAGMMIATVEPATGAPSIGPLTLFALSSAYKDQARLPNLEREGFALVQAWPLAAPHVLDAAEGYRGEEYVLCAIRTFAAFKAGVRKVEPERIEALVRSDYERAARQFSIEA